MRRAFREHTHTVAVYIVHKWSTYMEDETHTQRAGARVNRGQAVLYTGTQKEIWDTFVLFAYLLALFSQSYVLTMIHHHYNSIYPIYISLLYILHVTISTKCASQSPLTHYKQTHPKSQVTQHTHNNANNSTLWSQRPDPPLLSTENCSFIWRENL